MNIFKINVFLVAVLFRSGFSLTLEDFETETCPTQLKPSGNFSTCEEWKLHECSKFSAVTECRLNISNGEIAEMLLMCCNNRVSSKGPFNDCPTFCKACGTTGKCLRITKKIEIEQVPVIEPIIENPVSDSQLNTTIVNPHCESQTTGGATDNNGFETLLQVAFASMLIIFQSFL